MATSPGKKREFPESHSLGNPTQSRIVRSKQLFGLSLGTVLSCLAGELHDETSASHPHHGCCDPWAGMGESPIHSEGLRLPIKPI